MKKLITLLFLGFMAQSQIAMTFEEVKKEYGNNYEIQDADMCAGDFCVKYISEHQFGARWMFLSFLSTQNYDKLCNYVHIIEPKSRANFWINTMEENGYVSQEMKRKENGDRVYTWIDYESELKYEVIIFKGGVSITKALK